MQTRQLMTAMLLALTVFFAYQWIIHRIFPTPPQPTTPPAMTQEAPPTAEAPIEAPPPETGPAVAPPAGPGLSFVAGPDLTSLHIGGREGDPLSLTLSPLGAAVETIRITQRENGRYRYRAEPDSDEPYPIVAPVPAGIPATSYSTAQLSIKELEQRWELHDLPWQVTSQGPDAATFSAELRGSGEADAWLRLTKTYRIRTDKPVFDLDLSVENLSDRPLTIQLQQNGPTGLRREGPMYDMRRLVVAQREGGAVEKADVVDRGTLLKAAQSLQTKTLFVAAPERTFVWTALANRFFGVFTREVTAADQPPRVLEAQGRVSRPDVAESMGDLVATMICPLPVLPAGERTQVQFQVYVGPKDPEVLEQVDPAYVDPNQIYYTLAHTADQRCCTFEPLPQIMVGLLHGIHFVVRNYGIAIIILVLIIRTLLHPLSVFQQKSMYRMQDSMARVQPKMQAIRERFANDKVKQNQEMMRLYAEEGVNPMGSLVGMLPLFLQMPILVALWTGLNTDIELRHAPFDGWWIEDLAAPDAAYEFAQPLTIPILSALPLIGWMFTGIPSINLLPLLMGVSMWLQQKYMPKPGMQAKLEAAKNAPPPAERRPGQLTPQEQMRQQQMIAYTMSIMFPIMFYYMPSGLNLYWMATNIFGIFESIIIRRQLEEEKKRREKEGPAPPKKKKPGFVSKTLRRMAEQAEELQRKADELSAQDAGKGRKGPGKDNGKKR